MSRIKIGVFGRRKRLSYDEFMVRHQSQLSDADFLLPAGPKGHGTSIAQMLTAPYRQPPLPPLMWELKRHPFFGLLGAAARENCPEGYSLLLFTGLIRMGITPPEGVFVDPPGKPGRPRDTRTAIIYDKWMEIGEPPLGRQKLAHALFGSEFTKASSAERKKIVDRCRRAVERHQAQLRRKPAEI